MDDPNKDNSSTNDFDLNLNNIKNKYDWNNNYNNFIVEENEIQVSILDYGTNDNFLDSCFESNKNNNNNNSNNNNLEDDSVISNISSISSISNDFISHIDNNSNVGVIDNNNNNNFSWDMIDGSEKNIKDTNESEEDSNNNTNTNLSDINQNNSISGDFDNSDINEDNNSKFHSSNMSDESKSADYDNSKKDKKFKESASDKSSEIGINKELELLTGLKKLVNGNKSKYSILSISSIILGTILIIVGISQIIFEGPRGVDHTSFGESASVSAILIVLGGLILVFGLFKLLSKLARFNGYLKSISEMGKIDKDNNENIKTPNPKNNNGPKTKSKFLGSETLFKISDLDNNLNINDNNKESENLDNTPNINDSNTNSKNKINDNTNDNIIDDENETDNGNDNKDNKNKKINEDESSFNSKLDYLVYFY